MYVLPFPRSQDNPTPPQTDKANNIHHSTSSSQPSHSPISSHPSSPCYPTPHPRPPHHPFRAHSAGSTTYSGSCRLRPYLRRSSSPCWRNIIPSCRGRGGIALLLCSLSTSLRLPQWEQAKRAEQVAEGEAQRAEGTEEEIAGDMVRET